MRKHIYLKALFITSILFSYNYNTFAQKIDKKTIEKSIINSMSPADSLINEFSNTVYNCFYNPVFWIKSNTPTFTTLKIHFDKKGKVSDMIFSDSADTLFINTFLSRPKYHNDKLTLEKYAKAKSYTDISILIPIYYEPNYKNGSYNFDYNKIGRLMRFNKKYFNGKAIVLSPP